MPEERISQKMLIWFVEGKRKKEKKNQEVWLNGIRSIRRKRKMKKLLLER